MTSKPPPRLGTFEELILLVVRGMEIAYGVPIHKAVSESRGFSTSLGAVYVTLERLVAKGWLTAAESEPRAERGGRARRLYALTRAGHAALASADQARHLDGVTAGVFPR